MQAPTFRQLIYPYRTVLAGAIVVQILFSLLGLSLPWMLKIAIDRILPNSDYTLFWILVGVMAIIYILRSVIRYMSGFLGTYVVSRVLLDVRNKLFRHLQSLSLRFYDEYRTGKLISNVINDVALLQQLVSLMISMSDQIFSGITVTVMLFFLNWKLALVSLAVLPLHYVNFRHFRDILKRDSLTLQERMSEISANLSENLNGIKVIKSFSQEHAACRRFFSTMRPTVALQIQLNINSNLCATFCEILSVATYLTMIGLGIKMAKEGTLTYGDFAAFYAYLGLLLGPIAFLSSSSAAISQGLAGATRITRLLSLIPEIRERENPIQARNLHGDIVFSHVDFQYKDTPVLKDFSLEIKAGQKVAFVGPSGCGKSTASNLILRFYDVVRGSITVDGVDIRDYSIESYRGNIGVVLQEPFLFSGTVRDNIAYARTGASDAEVMAASKLANVDEFVKTLPNGYDTVLGENGASLSGGQKQRLAIARAILKNPSILILDEATSALDTISEQLVQAALDRVMENRTTLIIAHRLSTIRNADKIVVFQSGRIIQCGTHDELMSEGGEYRDLYTMQDKAARK